jgi:biopolymer transport protein ExbD
VGGETIVVAVLPRRLEMPSKGLTVLIVLFVVGSTWGLTQMDLRAPSDIPHYPPGYGDAIAIGPAWPGTAEPGEQPEMEPETEPEPEPEVDNEEIRIRNLHLTKLSSEGTTPVTRDPNLVRIDIEKEGVVRVGGIDLGSWDFNVKTIRKKAQENPKAHFVLVPDRTVPWQYVYWLVEALRDAGVTKIGIGGYPDYDTEGTLLAEIEVQLPPAGVEPTLPDGMVQLDIVLSMNDEGKTTYEVFGSEASGLADLFTLVSSYNGDYADEFGKDYARDAGKTPWVLKAPSTMGTGHVLVTLDAVRRAAVYTVRFGGEFPPPPK